eukprot:579512-Prorocentrum_minimum.AAC.1
MGARQIGATIAGGTLSLMYLSRWGALPCRFLGSAGASRATQGVYSHDGPIGRKSRRYILTTDPSDASRA